MSDSLVLVFVFKLFSLRYNCIAGDSPQNVKSKIWPAQCNKKNQGYKSHNGEGDGPEKAMSPPPPAGW